MKKTFFCLWIIMSSFSLKALAQGGTGASNEKEAISLACYWFETVIQAGSITEMMSISTLPFALDKEKVLRSSEELRSMYSSIFEKKGVRSIPRYSVSLFRTYNEIIEGSIPLQHHIIMIHIEDGDHIDDKIMVTILQQDQTFKIAGFSD